MARKRSLETSVLNRRASYDGAHVLVKRARRDVRITCDVNGDTSAGYTVQSANYSGPTALMELTNS
jgi:hypothetical protein